ncbi:peptide-methionine (R)-S-oxide reductase [Jannaschia donghaensis]|uniref:peptide-methionine (R)-S-oxide reductase n=1 Tax=Jannaschia donghaensis TaxID=420998 RepID=A0A0M6YF07_9RHOB|nr:peptide-methionine (R)-S-oxide reductase [Jannaschia donghaensis]CTQ48339.1 Peptide methionine sulfoxide reductase MsrB [Jannaschia donghaensis]
MTDVSRRALLAALPAGAAATLAPAAMAEGHGDGFQYEIIRTDDEWRALLSDDEYAILREGGTERPKSDPLWDSTEAGMYACKGCDLPVYDARWKVVLDVGFLFYRHAEPDSVMTSIDRSVYGQLGGGTGDDGPVVPEGLSEDDLRALDTLLLIETHCRRCASHLGHILLVQQKLLHCINGTALNFTPETA